jgi:hypothetical protein
VLIQGINRRHWDHCSWNALPSTPPGTGPGSGCSWGGSKLPNEIRLAGARAKLVAFILHNGEKMWGWAQPVVKVLVRGA